ncbi:MAG: inositol monophosphatase family protein [Leptolyngbyaceae cyanobacterium SM1_1_3]|nr:inositol monophosphatase family protein [Leptolyngbyaceae cyanobacterium SM1_1_3]NJN03008.1 inositol monophosphatase family protein [Leptolyngbyaceae cyanobacterium RM1_1_2]NJO08363.1 inositol monophosphatase family protein [Leptolyngbyaceae cyanobacterium SL_1_1]
MSDQPTPRQILEVLLPHLRVAAAYAQQIQTQIAAHPDKDYGDNFFATALTDADLSIQTFVEVALLGLFPQIRFYGEEHEKTYNTKYFRAIDLGPDGDYLITLDPIDGTRFYLDGHPNYQIILGVLNADDFEAVLAINPAQSTYYYALRGAGAFKGTLLDNLDQCRPLQIAGVQNSVLLGWQMGAVAEHLRDRYRVISVRTDYDKDKPIPNVNGVLSGELTGAILSAGKFIDGAALAFIAREVGYQVTTHDGSPLPPLQTCEKYQWPGLVIASSKAVHQDLTAALTYLCFEPGGEER